MKSNEIFLETAHRIGQRIARQAIWDGNACTWDVLTPERKHAGNWKSIPTRADGNIYQGTSGIALFLVELHRHTQDAFIKQSAEGAIRYALSEADKLPEADFSFHSGRVGIAYASARVGRLFDNMAFLEAASHILTPLMGNEHQDHGIDVISGAAGAIPALLQLTELLNDDRMLRMATALGDYLIYIAHREPVGWSWGTVRSISPVRNLLGYAHGAAGIGHALLELYHATGMEVYRYAAEQAFFYEQQFFDEQKDNWPDFRHHEELVDLLSAGCIEEAKALVRGGSLPPYKVKYMSAWCHGAPGIGLARLRAFDLLQHSQYRRAAEAAVKTTKATLQVVGNYSLCHGLSGNSETLLMASDVFNDSSLQGVVEHCGQLGWERFEKAEHAWPCGTTDGRPDPSLMLGEAGIGYFYLRLYSTETPSVLLLRAPGPLNEERNLPNRTQLLQHEYVEQYFGRTLNILEGIQGKHPLWDSTLVKPPESSEVKYIYDFLKDLVMYTPSDKKEFATDAFLPERVRYEMTLALADYTVGFIERLGQIPMGELDWDTALFHKSPGTQLVRTKWDWDRWLEEDKGTNAVDLQQEDVFFILYRADNDIQLRRISVFAVLVLQQLKTPTTLAQVVHKILNSLDAGQESDNNLVEERVKSQLLAAYRIGVIRHYVQPVAKSH